MSSRRLAALHCSRTQIDPEDDYDFCFVMCFLEERWLKNRNEDWLVSVMDETSQEKKNTLLDEYVSTFSYRQSDSDSRRVVVDRALAAAIRSKYDEKTTRQDPQSLTATAYTQARVAREEKERAGANPLNKIDCSQSDIAESISALCAVIGITPHPDPEICLRAACSYIENELNEGALKSWKEEEAAKRERLDLKTSFPLGVAPNKDPAVNVAARLLRILALDELKSSQRIINDTLIQCQNIIAEIQTEKRKRNK